MARVCGNLKKVPARTASCRTRSIIKESKLSTPRLILSCERESDRHTELLPGGPEKGEPYSQRILLRPGIRYVINEKRRGPLQKKGKGLPEQHQIFR